MAGDSQTTSQGRSRGGNRGGRSGGDNGGGSGGGGGRGRNRRGGGGKNQDQANSPQNTANAPPAANTKPAQKLLVTKPDDNDDDASSDTSVEDCFICANPIQHYSIAPCNHTTCHICGLRMRALYKTKDCAHCRTPSDFVIFTDDPNKRYEDYAKSEISSEDVNIGIKYVNEDIVGDTVLLLRYNCPDPDCDYAGLGLPDLHKHTKNVHHKKMCDLCTRNKKVFTHEHILYEHRELDIHMKKGDDKPGAVDQSGFRGHPICGFCNERFYDDDKLFEHCRSKHERCFLCDRQNPRQPHYYENYDSLERHFKMDHYLCLDRECMEKKFVVFSEEVDLKVHQLEEHANSLSKDVRRDLQTVSLSSFQVRAPYQGESSEGGRGGRSRRNGRNGHGRDPNADTPLVPVTHHMRRDEIAFHRQQALQNGHQPPARSQPVASSSARPARESPISTSNLAPVRNVDISSMTPEERAKMARHQTVIERASNMVGNDSVKLAKFREHVSDYKNGGLTPQDMLDSLFTLFDNAPANSIATLIRELAELYDDSTRAQELRKALESWRAINEDYPSLPGLAGMHGATTSSSGWAGAATGNSRSNGSQQANNRLMKLKHSTRGPTPVSSSGASSWVSPSTANSGPPPSSAFPALPSSSRSTAPVRSVPIRPAPRVTTRVAGGSDAFPELPPAPRPQTTIFAPGGRGNAVRRDFGAPRDTGFSWSANNGGSSSTPQAVEEPREEATDVKKKKGKKAFKRLVL